MLSTSILGAASGAESGAESNAAIPRRIASNQPKCNAPAIAMP